MRRTKQAQFILPKSDFAFRQLLENETIRERFNAEKAFSFNASYYTQEELEKKTHNYELIESDSVVFCVDYALNGIGSNSCGPVVLEQYRFDDVLFRFQFTLIPYVKG